MKKLAIVSNFYNEIAQCPSWYANMGSLLESFGQKVNESMIIVDSGSQDGTIEFFEERGVKVVVNDVIRREGYGPARNHLRQMAVEHLNEMHWACYLDADERISPKEFHQLRVIKDNLAPQYDVVALPRIDWENLEMTKMKKDINVFHDFQARMTRLSSSLRYVKSLHEGVENYSQIYADLSSPKINHFHRSTPQEKRDQVGRVCAHLHMKDEGNGIHYDMHHKEQFYRDQLANGKGLD